jgi:hypothetical protein
VQAPITYAQDAAVLETAAFEVMPYPSPFWLPPKYSATKAVMTATGAAILRAVNR